MTNDTLSDNRRKRHIYMDSTLDDLPLTMEAYRVYCHLCRRAGCDNNAFPSYKSIGEACFRGSFPNSPTESLRRKAIAAVHELLAWNLVTKTSREKDGWQTSNHYSLTDMEDWLPYPTKPSSLIRGTKQSLHDARTINSAEGTPGSVGGTLGVVLGEHPGSVGGTLGVVLGGHPGSVGGTPKDYPIEDYPIEVYPFKKDPPTPKILGEEEELENSISPQETIPQSLTSLSTKPESSHQTENPSTSTILARSFDKTEQTNILPNRDSLPTPNRERPETIPFSNRRQFIPTKGTYKSVASDPWMVSANMPNAEFAQWLFNKRYKHLPGKMLSDAKAEIRNNFERAGDLWLEFLADNTPKHETPEVESSLGYYSKRSLEWHKATFCELLDLADRVGQSCAIAQFTNRYDQQHTGATALWLNWLQANYPHIYAHLHQSAA
jgi:hypothetical protein